MFFYLNDAMASRRNLYTYHATHLHLDCPGALTWLDGTRVLSLGRLPREWQLS